MTKLDNDLISRKALLEVLSNLSVKNITDGDTYELVEGLFDIFRNSITNAPTIEADSGEAVAWIHPMYLNSSVQALGGEVAFFKPNDSCIPLYTSLQKREWVELTDDEVHDIADFSFELVENFDEVFKFYKNISAKLKEINHG